jgi:LPS-assembly protein
MGYFDLRGYYIQGLSSHDVQSQLPIVHPVFDYNKLIEVPKDRTAGIGGDIIVDANLTSLSRTQAAFQAIGARQLDQAFRLYDVCETPVPDPANPGRFIFRRTYNPGACFVKGIGGNYTRATAQVSWQRKFIDPIGQTWTPFAFLRGSASATNLDLSHDIVFASASGRSILSNADQRNFFGDRSSTSQGSVMPGVGLEYRYPFIARASFGEQVFEPIAQIIVRPGERRKGTTPNEDAQSLVFDAANLFSWDKFSGYDRSEGGTRLNVGAQYTLTFNTGAYLNIIGGQSIQLAGRNSYAAGDIANIGIGSGLDKKASDYVARVTYAPRSDLSFIADGRFDQKTFALKRLNVGASINFGRLSTDILYARYAAQPEIGYPKRREGLYTSAKFNVTDNFYVNGTVMFDMARYLYDVTPQKSSRFSTNLYGFGIGYKDECTTFGLNYVSYLNDPSSGDRTRNQTVMFKLELRTLGDIKGRTNIGGAANTTTTSDGLLP